MRTIWERHRDLLATALLLLVNYMIVRRLFSIEYTIHMGSIEASFISLARYIRDHWGAWGWFPLWFNGMPFPNTYQPALHLSVAAVSQATGWTAALAYHFVTALTYMLGPVSLFWMARGMTGSTGYSLSAALLYSLFSPSCLLSSEVRTDVGRLFYDRRLQAMVQYGEGPHITSLLLIPLAIWALHRVLERWSWPRAIIAAIGLAAVVLTNWPGTVVLACAVIALGAVRPWHEWRRTWSIIAGASVIGYALIATWIPPSTTLAILSNAQKTGADYGFGVRHLVYLVVLAGGGALVGAVLRRVGASLALRFFALFAWLMFAVTMGWFWAHQILLPQPHRFHLAMEMGLILTAVFLTRHYLSRRPQWEPIAATMLALALIYPFLMYRKHTRDLLRRTDIAQTSEYRMSMWIRDHLPGQRVMVPGSISFWMNTWNDVPQLSGCCDQGIVQQMLRAATYVVQSDDGAGTRAFEISQLWFRAMGVQAVGVSGPRSTETFHPFHHWDKFEGRLPVLWRQGDDVVYRVADDSLAHALRPDELVTRAPVNGIDTEPLEHFVASLNRPLRLTATPEGWQAEGTVRRGERAHLQVAWDKGWEARVNGQKVPVQSDLLGFLVADPQCDGPCRVDWIFTGGWERFFCNWISRLAVAGSAVVLLLGRRQSRAVSLSRPA